MKDYCYAYQIYSSKYSNHIRKNPEWMICHGLTMIYGGIGSFAFHASYTKMGHKLDITGVFSMTSYPAIYSIFNIFLEDLNRYCRIGDIVSKFAALAGFVVNIWLGFLIVAKRSEWKIGSEIFLGIFVSILIVCLIFKALKEWILGRYFNINVGYLIIALLSIAMGALCQESILKTPCIPASLWQWHSLWHFFASVALFLSIIVFWTEDELNSHESQFYYKNSEELPKPRVFR